jgi:hypothetical protein
VSDRRPAVEHARWAEEQGFTTVWYARVTAGKPLVAIALAGRAMSRIELGSPDRDPVLGHLRRTPDLQADDERGQL